MDNETTLPAKGSGVGLIEFLDFVAEKGYAKRSTISGFKSACKKVLETVYGEKWKETNVLELVYSDLKTRFENLSPISSGSLSVGARNTYITRFRSAVDLYRGYVDSPNVKPELNSRTRGVGKKTPPKSGKSTGTKISFEKTTSSEDANTPKESFEINDKESTKYQFPLRHGFTAYVTLPKDLTYREAKRLSAFIQTLAVDEFAYATVVSGELEN